jgi:predicted extracellular nuclease
MKVRWQQLISASLAVMFLLSLVMTPAEPAQADTAELFFSEYIEGSSYNKALEIYNGTGAAVDLAAGEYSIFMSFNGGSSTYTINLTGTVADGDVYVVAPTNAVLQAILDAADQLQGTTWFNGDDAIVLQKSGVPVDVIGQVGVDPGDYWGAAPVSTQNTTLRRKSTVCAGDPDGSDAFDPSLEWDGYSVDTVDGLGAHTAACDALAPKINEFVANHVGTDTSEYVEIYGAPSTDYSNLSILSIEGDSDSSMGTVDKVLTAGTTDALGLWWTGFLPSNSIENGSMTLLLVEGFTEAVGYDLDADDNGEVDEPYPWTSLLDGVAVNDGGLTDLAYDPTVLAISYDGFAFVSGGASRIPDGYDTDAVTDWVRNDFDLAGIGDIPGTPVVGEAYNTPGETNEVYELPLDLAPEVISTSPVNGASMVPLDSDILLTFSELVTVGTDWFTLECSQSGSHTAADSTLDNITFTLNPDSDFVLDDLCTLTVDADAVTDQDLIDPPDAMPEDFTLTFTTGNLCSLPYTHTYEIQGTTDTPAITGVVTVQGVVVSDNEGPSPELRGFYLQDLEGDEDPLTSDGIFIYNGDLDSVDLGDVVRVTGNASDYQYQTQVSASVIFDCGMTDTVDPVDVTLPFADAAYLERFEGMLVQLPQTLIVSEHYLLGRFGQVTLSSGDRLWQPTNIFPPGEDADDLNAANLLNQILLDDSLNNQNPDPIVFGRGGLPLSAANTLRGGDTVTGIVGVMTYTWGGNSASPNAYRVRPLDALGGGVPDFQPANPRPSAPEDLNATINVAGMNLLNFFDTWDGLPDAVDNCTLGVGGDPTDCRGADTEEEFNRQWPKTVAGMLAVDADVYALTELENDGYDPDDSAIGFLVSVLNAATEPGTYAFIDADALTSEVNTLGTDAIKVGIIYKTATVEPVGTTAALNSEEFVNAGDNTARNRPALAQAFRQISNDEVFTVVVNHLKSKGSACDDPDAGDLQGNCNIVRTIAAGVMADWLATDPTETADPDILIMGDLNSYAMEDPIAALEDAGYTNLIRSRLGMYAYSYVFNANWGYLDHALVSPSVLPFISGMTLYHINADEPSVLDYNTNYKTTDQIVSLYEPDQYRLADHDVTIVGLNLGMTYIYLPVISN